MVTIVENGNLDRLENEKKINKKIIKQVIKETGKSKSPQVTVQMLVDAVKDLDLTTDTDKLGFVNFRYVGTKKILFYAIDRQFDVAISTHDNSTKSGWKTSKLINREDFDGVVQTLKSQIQNRKKFEAAYIPWYHCIECNFTTQSKDELTAHLVKHGGE
jgi:hypothetical protein